MCHCHKRTYTFVLSYQLLITLIIGAAPEEKGADVGVRWEWEGDDGWTPYNPTHNQDITLAFRGRKPHVMLQVCNAYMTYIWQVFSLAVAWPSLFDGHIGVTSLESLLLLTALQCSLLSIIEAIPPNCQIKVTARYKSYIYTV